MITRNFHVRDQPEPRPATTPPPVVEAPARPGLLRRVLAGLDRLRGR